MMMQSSRKIRSWGLLSTTVRASVEIGHWRRGLAQAREREDLGCCFGIDGGVGILSLISRDESWKECLEGFGDHVANLR